MRILQPFEIADYLTDGKSQGIFPPLESHTSKTITGSETITGSQKNQINWNDDNEPTQKVAKFAPPIVKCRP